MSSIIKNQNLNIKENSTYYVDSNKVNIDVSPSDAKDTMKNALDELEQKIGIAEKEYNQILEQCDEKIKDTERMIEQIKQEAYDEAFNEGTIAAKANFEQLILQHNHENAELLNKFQEEKKEFVNVFKETIKTTFYEIFDNILNIQLNSNQQDTKKKMIDLIILKGLNHITDEKEVKVVLCEDDYNSLDKDDLLTKLGRTDYSVSFSSRKDLKSGDCILETDLGVVDVGMDNLKEMVGMYITNNIY